MLSLLEFTHPNLMGTRGDTVCSVLQMTFITFVDAALFHSGYDAPSHRMVSKDKGIAGISSPHFLLLSEFVW